MSQEDWNRFTSDEWAAMNQQANTNAGYDWCCDCGVALPVLSPSPRCEGCWDALIRKFAALRDLPGAQVTR